MKFLRNFFIFAVCIFSLNNVSAKDLYLNNSGNGDCLTENTACSSFEDAMIKAENGDIIYLQTNIVYGGNNTGIFDLKGVIIEGNNNRLTFRGQDINLLGDVTLNDLDLSILPDGSHGGKIFMNGKNLTLNSIKTQTQANDVLPTIVAGSKENTGNFSDFNLIISSARGDNHFKEIITSGLDSKAVPVNVEIGNGVKVEKVKSIGEKSGMVQNNSTKTNDFENIFSLEFNSINGLSDFSLKNISNLNLKDNTNISISNFENISFLTLGSNITLNFKNSGNIEIENLNSLENNLIKLGNENIFSVRNFTINSNLKFEIDSEEEKVFVVIPKDKEENISGETKTGLKIFGKISEENGFLKFGLKSKDESDELKNLKKLLEEYDNLTQEQQDKVDIDIYNEAVDISFKNNSTPKEILEIINKLKVEIQKAKGEKTDLEKAEELKKEIENKKIELKKLLDLANLPETINGKTDETVKNLNDIKTESQKIYEKEDATLDQINAEISKLDLVIKNLKNKTSLTSGNSSSGTSSSSNSSVGSAPVKNIFTDILNTEVTKVEKNDKKEEIKTEKEAEKVEENKNLKTINISGKERKYEVKNNFSSCPMISNIVSDFRSDYVMTFSDVENNHNVDEIQRLEKVGIVKGTKPKIFEPERGITRAEFLAIVLKSHCYDFSEKPKNLPFYDVDLNSWQANVVKKAFDLGIISGYSDRTFKPNTQISKIEAFAIIYKISNLEIKENFSDSFVDKAALWQEKVLGNFEYLGILNPEKTGNKINPNSKISRNEIVKILVDILRLY